MDKYMNIVSSKEYEDWLYDYLKANKAVDDEDARYFYKGKDAEYGAILSDYFIYLLKFHHDDLKDDDLKDDDLKETCSNGFYTEYFDFMLRDLPCRISTVFGQGANTFIEVRDNNLVSSDPLRDYENCWYNHGCITRFKYITE